MTIVIFLIVLVALIVVHELGHFFAAKWSGMAVEEFGLGYPPRALTFAKKNGTEYTLNWLPFGGFVKIRGEDGDSKAQDSFTSKPRFVQALVLVAGIVMNLVFAWVLLSTTLALGAPRALTDSEAAGDPAALLTVSSVLPDSPAATAGFLPGDVIRSTSWGHETFTERGAGVFTTFISESGGELSFEIRRGNEELTLHAAPVPGVIASDPGRVALGLGVATIGSAPVPWWRAPYDGARATLAATRDTALGLLGFFASIFTFSADLSQVSGPVGIAGAVGDASSHGIVPLLVLTAIISINLALINLLPVPALDGGRLLFVIIEAITRKRIPEQVAGTINMLGFAFLILLMVAVTASDLWKLFT